MGWRRMPSPMPLPPRENRLLRSVWRDDALMPLITTADDSVSEAPKPSMGWIWGASFTSIVWAEPVSGPKLTAACGWSRRLRSELVIQAFTTSPAARTDGGGPAKSDRRRGGLRDD